MQIKTHEQKNATKSKRADLATFPLKTHIQGLLRIAKSTGNKPSNFSWMNEKMATAFLTIWQNMPVQKLL